MPFGARLSIVGWLAARVSARGPPGGPFDVSAGVLDCAHYDAYHRLVVGEPFWRVELLQGDAWRRAASVTVRSLHCTTRACLVNNTNMWLVLRVRRDQYFVFVCVCWCFV